VAIASVSLTMPLTFDAAEKEPMRAAGDLPRR
jgi:hypothetical protein